MKDKLDFERWQPPKVTEEMLLMEQAKRKRKATFKILYVAAVMYCIWAVKVIKHIGALSITAAFVCAAVLLIIVMVSSVATAAIISKKEDVFYD